MVSSWALTFRRSSRSSARSAAVRSGSPPCLRGTPAPALAFFTQLRSPSGLTPRSRATAVTVLSDDRASATASRLNSSE